MLLLSKTPVMGSEDGPGRAPWLESVPRLGEFLDLARSRRSTRAYEQRPIPDDVLRNVLTAANWAPSAANAQPWEFVLVKDEETKDELFQVFVDELEYKRELDPTFPLGGNTQEFRDAPVTVVVAGDTRMMRWYPQVEDGSREKLFHHSLAACIQTLHLAAASAGLGTTWVSCRGPSQHRLKELLDIPPWYLIASVAPIGYPDVERVPSHKSRIPVENKIHAEEFDRDQVADTEDIVEGKEEFRERVYQV